MMIIIPTILIITIIIMVHFITTVPGHLTATGIIITTLIAHIPLAIQKPWSTANPALLI